MREIKFRAWDKDLQEMHKIYIIDFVDEEVVDENADIHKFTDIELMQFTGLYDKNKVPIYEGDIVIFEDCEMSTESGYGDTFINQGVIEYNDENCCFNVTERITVELVDVLYKDNESLEVIGNIYDNPDLLGE